MTREGLTDTERARLIAALNTSSLTDDDRVRSSASIEAEEPDQIAALTSEYYRDLDRAERTPRNWLYFHMGLLAGAIARTQPRGSIH